MILANLHPRLFLIRDLLKIRTLIRGTVNIYDSKGALINEAPVEYMT